MELRHFLFLIKMLSFCYACFPTPASVTCPTIITGPITNPICPCQNRHMGCPYLNTRCSEFDIINSCPATCAYCVPYHGCDIRDASGFCPRDWKFNPATGKCYYATPFRSSYATISSFCASNQATVASVLDAAENVFIANYLPISDVSISPFDKLVCYFIGLRPNDVTWSAPFWEDGSPYSYNNWDNSPPPPAGFGPQPNTVDPNESNTILCHPQSPPGQMSISDLSWHNDFVTVFYPGICKRNACI